MTYEYRCAACGGTFEVEQRITDFPLQACNLCGGFGTAQRLVSGGQGFTLKGEGWYRDGYASKSPSATSGASSDK